MIIDLDKLFEDYLREIVMPQVGKVKPEVLEAQIPDMYEEWKDTPSVDLDGLSPRDYVAKLDDECRLIEIVREHCNTIYDKDTLEELLTVVRSEKGRIEAQSGSHDDLMMALAIAHHIREQVIFMEEPIITNPQFRFNVERMASSQLEYGEEMVVI